MYVVIAQVHKKIFDGEAESLSVSTVDGEITILPNHEPFVTNLKKGLVTVRTSKGEESFEISDGVLEVSENTVTIIL